MSSINRPLSSEPSFKDLLDLHKKDIMLSLNCHAIGIVEKFNTEKQTATIKIAYGKTFVDVDGQGKTIKKTVSYPVLVDCPTVIYSGGLAGLTMPISKGDFCLVLFNDRDIDNWFGGNKSGEVNSNRLHSLSDGIALVGLRSKSNFISDYDTVNPTFYNGEARIKIKSTKVLIENSTDKLGLLLAELIDTINAIQTTNAVVGVPCAISPASQTALNTVKDKITGLLE